MTVFVGDILNATAATVTGIPTPTQSWQWLRSGTALPGFTGTSYRVLTGDAGSTLAVRETETNFMGTASATSDPTATVGTWTPSTLFALSEPGVWYDADDYTAMFQDPAGTTPITGAGQTVGLLLDKSQGLVLGPELVTNGDFSSGTGWSFGANITISGGVATYSAFDVLSTTATATISNGKSYLIEFDQGGTGTVNPLLRFGQNSTNTHAFTSTNGRKRLLFEAGGVVDQVIRFRYNGTGTLTLDNITIKELPGNHATQSTLASRPTTVIRPMNAEQRNLLTRTEEFENAVWFKTSGGVGSVPIVTANFAAAPDGTMTADRVQFNLNGGTSGSDQSQISQGVTFTATNYTASFWLRSNTGSDFTIFLLVENNQTVLFTVTPTWQRLSGTRLALGLGSIVGLRARGGATSDAPDLLVWGAQVEVGSSATPYQKVVTTNEWYDPAVPSYRGIQFDGVDDFLVTPTITPGTDKAQVFAGVRKLSDAASGILVELSATVANNGTFAIAAPNAPDDRYLFGSRGTTQTNASTQSSSYNAPTTSVLSGLGDIAGDSSTLRINGAQIARNTGDQGTGNYLAYPLYIGRRGGSTVPYNGILTSLVVRFGANLSTSVINRAEYYVSDKTGVSL